MGQRRDPKCPRICRPDRVSLRGGAELFFRPEGHPKHNRAAVAPRQEWGRQDEIVGRVLYSLHALAKDILVVKVKKYPSLAG